MADWNALLPEQSPTASMTAPPANALLPDAGVNTADAYTSTLGAVSDWVAKQRADAASRGLWDAGAPTPAGWLDALHQYGGALVAGTAAPGGRGAPVAGQGAFDFAAPAAVAPAAAEAGVGGAPVNALMPAPRPPPAIVAYHGSGAEFDRFRNDKIGTGEGAQAYGYGHYVAGQEGVARGYRDAMAGKLSAEDQAAAADASLRGRQAERAIADVHGGMVAESMAHPDYRPTIEADGTPVVNTAIHPEVAAKYQPRMDAALAERDAARADMDAIQARTGPSVGGKPYNSDDVTHRAAYYLDRNGGDPARTRAAIEEERLYSADKAAQGGSGANYHADAVQRLEEMRPLLADGAPALPEFKAPGHMYEVGVHADPEHFLDWDKPLAEQSPHVKAALADLGYQTDPIKQYSDKQLMDRASRHLNSNETQYDAANDIGTRRDVARLQAALAAGPAEFRRALIDPQTPVWRREKILGKAFNPTGGELHQTMVDAARHDLREQSLAAGELPDPHMAPAFVADQLNDAGLAGIRYLDGSSRRAGEGTHNHVIFDPATMEILRKYGLAGLMAGGAAAGAAQTSPQP